MSSKHQLVLEGPYVDLDGVKENRIGIDDGIIREISHDATGERILHLEKYLTFPGFIDPHVHSRVPGGEHKEDYGTLSRAALHGGVTTVLDMPNTNPPTSTREVLQSKRGRASRESLVDVELFALVLPQNLDQLESLAQYAVGYKIYVGKSTGGFILPMEYLQDALSRIRKTNKPVTIHCEDQEIIDRNTELYPDDNRPEVHCDIRSPDAEVSAIQKVLEQAQPVDKINIAHISTAEGLSLVTMYKRDGYQVKCEVTPHHLFLTRTDMSRLGNYGRMNPPLRTTQHRDFMVEGLRRGVIDFLATDHAPHTRKEKSSPNAPSGVPGLDTYGGVVALLIKEYGFEPRQLVPITSSNATEFYDLGDRRIKVGNKANLTVLDLSQSERVDESTLQTKCGWSLFNGMVLPGFVRYTSVNGHVYDSQTLSLVA